MTLKDLNFNDALTITIEPMPGSSVEKVALLAYNLCHISGRRITYSLNGIKHEVKP